MMVILNYYHDINSEAINFKVALYLVLFYGLIGLAHAPANQLASFN